ncbi:hypothetical protein BB561_004949 [Smittium simulii]|uniref:Cyclin N-terminal domain-containing protein n=1 Tax=Smittium simulii TaxID=133385 RepID=A0A2T9YD79_9FUNG|nr:hypothetical protein BB561_004949 [Smittium simulii]
MTLLLYSKPEKEYQICKKSNNYSPLQKSLKVNDENNLESKIPKLNCKIKKTNTAIEKYLTNENFKKTAEFIDKVTKDIKLQDTVLAHTLVYVYRLKLCFPKFYTSAENSGERIFISSLLLATKYCQDNGFLTSKYAEYLCRREFDIDTINRMESSFLKILKYKLYVSLAEYNWVLLNCNY